MGAEVGGQKGEVMEKCFKFPSECSCLLHHTPPTHSRPQDNIKALADLTRLVRGELSGLHRRIVAALITIDVHARDIVMDLIKRQTRCGEGGCKV